jgi:hypothetical protein
MDTNGSADKSTADYSDQRSTQGEGQSGPKKRRRGSRGGKNRTKSQDSDAGSEQTPKGPGARPAGQIADPNRKPQIGDTRPSAAPAPELVQMVSHLAPRSAVAVEEESLVQGADQRCADQR